MQGQQAGEEKYRGGETILGAAAVAALGSACLVLRLLKLPVVGLHIGLVLVTSVVLLAHHGLWGGGRGSRGGRPAAQGVVR